jgi:hypothetical protein
MKFDVLSWAQSAPTGKLVSKETLNHPGLVELVSGLDVYLNTPLAYLRAYEALGIDLVNRLPLTNAPQPTTSGAIRSHPSLPYDYTSLGVFDSVVRHTYACTAVEEIFQLDMATINYDELITPAPHPCSPADIHLRESVLGEVGLYYPMLYTTLFMWAVEILGWEMFMLAASRQPEKFHQDFLVPCAEKSAAIVTQIAKASSSPFVFVHDDLASAIGPVFRPRWYDEWIFPHYPQIWKTAKQLGKKIIFVGDGDLSAFLPKLVESGVDGLMFESPATPLERVIEHFGGPGRYFIGGISTSVLRFGSPQDVWDMVIGLHKLTLDCPGFALASGGGLHGDLPVENLIAYFDARIEINATPQNWKDYWNNL